MLQSATTWGRCTRLESPLLAGTAAIHAPVCQAGRWNVHNTHAIQVTTCIETGLIKGILNTKQLCSV